MNMANKPAPEFLSTGELARLSSVSTDTLRHYERKGVLQKPPRSKNGYRRYPAQALDRILLVRSALGVGITLDELAAIFKTRAGGGAPCREVRDLVSDKLSDLENHLQEMLTLRDNLRSILRDWDKRLATTPAGKQARLLESLANPEITTVKSSKLTFRKKQRKESNEKP